MTASSSMAFDDEARASVQTCFVPHALISIVVLCLSMGLSPAPPPGATANAQNFLSKTQTAADNDGGGTVTAVKEEVNFANAVNTNWVSEVMSSVAETSDFVSSSCDEANSRTSDADPLAMDSASLSSNKMCNPVPPTASAAGAAAVGKEPSEGEASSRGPAGGFLSKTRRTPDGRGGDSPKLGAAGVAQIGIAVAGCVLMNALLRKYMGGEDCEKVL